MTSTRDSEEGPRKGRRGRWLAAGCTVLVLLLVAHAARAIDVSDILARMRRAAQPGRDMRAAIELIMTNARGERVHWRGEFYRIGGARPRTRLVLLSPVDLRGVSISVESFDRGADRTRIYLPFVRRVREIEADRRGETFLGTDFNYEDLGLEELEFEEHALLGEGQGGGRPCFRVQSIPERTWWYGRIVRCIDKKDWLPRHTEYYDPSGRLYKLRTFDRVETIGGHPTPLQITMQVVPERTSTRLVLRHVEYDTGLRDELFDTP